MSTLKKYSLSGEEIGDVAVDAAFLDVDASRQMIKDYIVALRANIRQWSANTKGRSEVSHSKKKPFRQKGTGNARQGSLASPQFRGGGIVFGPKPKFNQHTRINQKERQLASHQLLAEKIKSSQVYVLEDSAFASLERPSTKTVAAFLKKHNLLGRRVLFVGEGEYHEVEVEGCKRKVSVASKKHEAFKKSVRNLPKTAFAIAQNVNGYDLAASYGIVFSESAFEELKSLLV
ncbi:MAG: 50S ribosomal protein L4 [Chlamydiales bacterium]|nr:50S ribosomal protein L4 [Chlamydiales bacterium]